MGNFKSIINNSKKNNIEKDYFSIINKILNDKNISNSSLISNMKVCLNEKKLEQISITTFQNFNYSPNEEPKCFINWLDFIYQYLYNEYSFERYWANQIIEELDKEDFLSENKYLSEFFMEEFEMENKPKCLQIEIKNERKINFNYSTLNVTQNLGGSFDNSFSKNKEFDLATLKYKEFRDKVKSYIIIFKQHILNEDHPINRVAQIFGNIWVKYVKAKINLIKQNDTNYKDINKQINEITQQLQRFILHLQIGLKLFYSRTINYSFFEEEKDEIINLITNLVFRTGDIYDTIFELYTLGLIPEINDIREKFQKLKKISPEELGIPKQFCLNRKTLDYQEEILINKINKNKNNCDDFKNKIANKKSERTKSELSIDKNINIENKKKEIKEFMEQKKNYIESKNINLILKIVRDNKKRCPKYGDREIEETKVNLDYEENFYLISNQKTFKGDIFNNMGALLPINELDNKKAFLNYSNENIISIDLKKNDSDISFNNDKDLNNLKDEDFINENMIVRTATNFENGKNIIPTKLEKVFNRVSFIRTKNTEYLSYPYETAIQLLKQIQKYKTPFEKMMIIASISSELTDCINDFWKDFDKYIKNDLLNLETDQIMTIFFYIIIKSQIYDISVHCKIIKSFTTCITKASMIGYYYSTVEASIAYIQSLRNIKELLKNKIQ